MKKKLLALAAFVVALGSTAGPASAQDVLTGDTRQACEAILCLSSSTRPSECTPSLSRYFNITKRKPSDTIRARANFLQLCPVANQTPQMQSLVSAISQGAGRCDAQSLNSTMLVWTGGDDGYTYISNQMPNFCAAYTSHAYADFTSSSSALPRYVGTPERGGYWVEARNYDRTLAEHNERILREDEERRRQSWLN